MLLTDDPVHAFLDYPPVPVPSSATGPLAGLTLAVKDLYDVAGYKTGGGHPRIRAESTIRTASAPSVEALLDAGARFVGKTHTDEFAYSMNGENAHYGTPVNPRAPGRIPGGSSSGSAAAVAAGLVDIATASDTGGSVRVPASYNGLIGLRTTHGRIPLDGIQPLARTFDTVGWFARDMATYEKVGAVLLGEDAPAPKLSRLMVAEDLAAMVLGADETAAFRAALPKVAARFGAAGHVTVAPEGLERSRLTFRTLQAWEAWADHGAWIESRKPLMEAGIRDRFAYAATVTAEEQRAAAAVRAEIRARVRGLLGDDAVLVFPTAVSVAPPIGMEGDALEAFRVRNTSIQCSAGLAGVPQITLPLAEIGGLPFGISLMGPAGSDRALIALGAAILGG